MAFAELEAQGANSFYCGDAGNLEAVDPAISKGVLRLRLAQVQEVGTEMVVSAYQ